MWIDHVLAWVGRVVYRGRARRALRNYLSANREWTRPKLSLSRGGVELRGLRIAWLSDIHAGNYMDESDWLEICESVAREQPDLVCLGGDLVNLFEHEIHVLSKGLAALAPPLGCFAVPGNHEYYASRDLGIWRAALESAGVTVLLNRGVRVQRGAASLWLCGVDDLRRGKPDLDAALTGAASHEPVLLLSHNPDVFLSAAPAGVDLQLSGHTHGGQILVLGRTPLRQTRHGLWSGRFERGASQLYVGRGVGTTTVPIRIGARGEVALIELEVPDALVPEGRPRTR